MIEKSTWEITITGLANIEICLKKLRLKLQERTKLKE